jgi:uncharacterized protein involved in exopolysaccharide biosynthesis
MSTTPQFDLVDIVQTIRRRFRFVLIITIVAMIVGAVFYGVKEKKYKATAEFVVSNPLYADRYNMYGNDQRPVDYFGDDDDLDKIIILGESDTVEMEVIRNKHLAEMYNVDTTKPGAMAGLKGLVEKKYGIKRTEYKDAQVSFTDRDPVLAADVANEYVKAIEEHFRGYYNNMKYGLYTNIKDKVHQEDSMVSALTDTLAALREQYGIYDIISPSRNNLMMSAMKPSGKANYGRGMEQIQNIESLKDQLVTDRARHMTLLNQYNTGRDLDHVHFLQVVSQAKPPTTPAGLNGIYTVIACGLLGFFFSSLYVLIAAYYKTLIAVQR